MPRGAVQAAPASTFSKSEFRALLLKSGTFVKGPVVTVPPKLQPQSPLQINKIPVSDGEEVQLTLLPSSEVKLVEGPVNPGQSPDCPRFPRWVSGCAAYNSWIDSPTPKDRFPGRTATVARSSDDWITWSCGPQCGGPATAMDRFSFDSLSPGFRVSRYQVESLDLSTGIRGECLRGWPWYGSTISPDLSTLAAPVGRPNYDPQATWDDRAQTLSVSLDGWKCRALSFYQEIGALTLANYAITVWVTGPKGKSPWGGKNIRVR